MKKNMLFSIALCIGLVLPAMSLAAEAGPQSLYDRITGVFSNTNETIQKYLSGWATSLVNRLSDNQKYALYTALAAALGTAVYAMYSQSNSSTQGSYRGFDIDRTNPYAPNNMKNIAQFLHNAQFGSEESQNKAFFQNHVLPVLNLLQNDLPKKPTGNVNDQDKRTYIQNVTNFWTGFIGKVKGSEHSIPLPHQDKDYLGVINLMLEDGTPLKNSISHATLTLNGFQGLVEFM